VIVVLKPIQPTITTAKDALAVTEFSMDLTAMSIALTIAQLTLIKQAVAQTEQ
jgi:hypothetical protein